MVTLGEHLRADQQAGFAAVDGADHLLHRALARGAVAVDTQHRIVGEEDAQALLGAFRSGANRAQIHLAAVRTVARRSLDVPEEIGRASCRERGGPSVEITVVAESLKKKNQKRSP